MFRFALRSVLARKTRLALTSIAVVLGTAFLAGTSIFSATLSQSFDNLFADVFKNVNAYVRSSDVIEVGFGIEERPRISSSLVDTVKEVPGVLDAAGDIQAFARVVGSDGKPLGSDGQGPPTFGSVITDYKGSLWSISSGRLPNGATEVALDEYTFDLGNFTVGDSTRVIAQSGSREFTIVGVASYGDVRTSGGATFALFDVETASEFLAEPGVVDQVLVTGDGSLSDEELASRIDDVLPKDSRLETLTGAEITEEAQNQIGDALSFISIFLSIFSYIALGVGCFVIYNVFSISAAQRQKENALLRAIGASKRQVTGAMLIEAAVIGIFGSVIGLVSGIGLSRGLSALLSSFGIDLPSTGLVVSTSTIISTIIVGLLVTMLSSFLPARRAGRVPPLAAMRETAVETTAVSVGRLVSGLLFTIAGVGATIAVIAGADAVLLGLAIVLVFIGTLILGPIISRPLALFIGIPIEKIRGVPGRMARDNAARNPKRTARTSAPVMIGVALVTAVTALAVSIQSQIRDVVGEQFYGDYAISVNSFGFGGLSPDLADEINELPEVETATGIGTAAAVVDGGGTLLTVITPQTISEIFDFGFIEGNVSSLTADGIFVSESRAKRLDVQVGSPIDVTLADSSVRTLTVQGIYTKDEIAERYIVSRDLFEGTTVARFDFGVYILTRDDIPDEQARAALQTTVDEYGVGKLQSIDEFIDEQAAQINQLLGLIYGLLALSIIIAIVGIIITLLLSVYERQREIGLLRAVGMTRSQVRSTVRWESVITSLQGAVLGAILGVGLGWIIVFALRDQGLRSFEIPLMSLFWILVMSFIVGVIAAVYPAYRATKVNILRSITTN
jgi:putative ABC transport system permease protein